MSVTDSTIAPPPKTTDFRFLLRNVSWLLGTRKGSVKTISSYLFLVCIKGLLVLSNGDFRVERGT